MLTDYQINAIASSISSLDVIEYINTHEKEYQKFLVEEKKKEKEDIINEEYRKIEETINLGKLELSVTR